MKLTATDDIYAICRLDADEIIPDWLDREAFWSVTRTEDELSVVCLDSGIPEYVKAERGWRMFKVQGPLDFGLTGILSAIASPLAAAKISIFALSTFDTDYILLKGENLDRAKEALSRAGFAIEAY